MLLGEKNAVIYGAAGAVGGAIARAFAREGASLFLADDGRRAALDALADGIAAAGGAAHAATVDAAQKHAVDRHAAAVVQAAGSIDVSVNVSGIDQLAGPGARGAVDQRELAIFTRAQVLTSTAAARQMARQRSGVILTLSSEAGATACASVEALTRQLTTELSPHGIRVACLRPDAIPPGPRTLDDIAEAAVTLAASPPAPAAERPPCEPPEALKALLGPQRSAVLMLLDEPATAGRIAEALHTVPGGATHHLRGLEAAGLISRSRRGQYVIVERTERGTALLSLYHCVAAADEPAVAQPLIERHAKARLASIAAGRGDDSEQAA